MKNYEIKSSTLVILPIDSSTSKVYEEDQEYIIEKSANSIIKENCEFYGSSYEGRCVGTKSLTGIKSKFPIIIEESRNMIFFPTNSIRNKLGTWISFNNVKEFRKNNKSTTIIFKNNKSVDIDISYYSVENQLCRAAILKSKLYDFKNNEKVN